MLSLWEKRSFLHHDVIVVGSGITGLSTAISLKEKAPKLDVLVLEKGLLPSGASTKNAGFACFGSVSELVNDLEIMGEKGMLDLVKQRWEGLKITRKRLGDHTIDFQQKGGFELIFEKSDLSGHMQKLNGILTSYFDQNVFRVSDRLNDFGFQKTANLIENVFEGQLDTGKLMDGLWRLAMKMNIKIVTGAEVLKMDENKVFTSTHSFSARAIALCTNAFTKSLLPDTELSPGRGMVLSIKPEGNLPFEGTFHYDSGFYYFRDFNDRLIFGGGRNLDFETETTTEFGVNEQIEKKLLSDLRTIILPERSWQVEMKWAGIMAFGKNKAPIIKKVNDHLYAGIRLGGMGVALGSKVGEDLSSHILSSAL
mgnify:CR=1 FL=1